MANKHENSLCIIGTGENKTDIELLDKAKKAFDSVFYVPIESIAVGLQDDFTINYRVTDLLKFKAVFPRIPRKGSSYAYQLLSLFPENTFMPIRPISFLLAEERFFLLSVLRKREIPTLNLTMSRSPTAAIRTLEQSGFPLVIRTPDKKTGVVVNNNTEAKSVIEALGSLNQSIIIEELVKDVVSVYVASPEVLASVRKKTKEKDIVFGVGELKKAKIDVKTRQLAIDAARAVEAQIAKVDICVDNEPVVVNVELAPDLIKPSEATGIDMIGKVVEYIRERYETHKEKPMLMKFFDDAKSVVKDVLKTKQLL